MEFTIAQLGVLMVFLAVLMAAIAIYMLTRKTKTDLERRVESLSRRTVHHRQITPISLIREGEMGPGGRFLNTMSRLLPQSFGGNDLRLKLIRAGYPWRDSVAIFLGIRVSSLILLGVAGVLAGIRFSNGPMQMILMAAVGTLVGYILPDMYLWSRANSRREEIVHGLPDALDLMVICVEAGLGMNAALLRVGTEIESVCAPLSQELRLVNREMLAGVTRSDALKNLAYRTGVDDVKSLVGILVQTERLGTSIAKSLRVHADNLRVRRRHRAEEKARKVAIKLVFPLVLFIFPTLLVIILGPGVIRLVRVLSDVGS